MKLGVAEVRKAKHRCRHTRESWHNVLTGRSKRTEECSGAIGGSAIVALRPRQVADKPGGHLDQGRRRSSGESEMYGCNW